MSCALIAIASTGATSFIVGGLALRYADNPPAAYLGMLVGCVGMGLLATSAVGGLALWVV